MAYPFDTQAHLLSTQADGLDSQMGGFFYNLDTQDALPDFHDPEKDIWQSQAQDWDPAGTGIVAENVAEVALQESTPYEDAAELARGMAGVSFQDAEPVDAGPMAFQEPGGADVHEEEPAAEEVPEWSCSYCGIHKLQCCAQCEATGKWFCNGNVTAGGSCIIQHLVRGRYKEVRLHKDSPLGNSLMECYHSGSRNIFALGFVPVKSENTVVLLTRDTPATAPCVKDLDLDLSLWEPIVQDRAIVPWLVRQPTAEENMRARKLKPAQQLALEELWKSNPAASLDNIIEAQAQEEPVHVALRYEDAYEYQNVFAPLISIEAEYSKACREALRKENLRVTWQQGGGKKWVALFHFPRDDEALHVMPGDELLLQHETGGKGRGPWEAVGVVVQITALEEVALELRMRKGQQVPSEQSTGFAAELTWNSTSYDRMQAALKTFAEDENCISHFLYHKLLGHDPEEHAIRLPRPAALQAPHLPTPNHSQVAAIEAALTRPLTLIQGPPGTGKTVTSATLVWLLQQATRGKVLVAAPSNVAVDHLAEKLEATQLKVVRICSRLRESMDSAVEHLTLHYQATNLKVPGRQQLQKLLQMKEDKQELSLEDERKLHQLRRAAEIEILKEADIVCVTCIGAGDKRLRGMRFPIVLVDESTQATEAECLMPLMLGARQVTFVGDHCQLGPVITNKLAGRCGLTQSLVERMILCGVQPIRLQVQYRMHPCLSEFPSNTFYEGALQNGVTEAERLHSEALFPWPDPDHRHMFMQQAGTEEISSSGTSYVNRQEAATVEKIVTRFLSFGLQPHQLGVITPYEGQRAQIVRVMDQLGPLNKRLYAGIEVASVDAFQGREKDYIIFSCVRSSQLQGIGFLSDPRRLNVALTRAKYGLVILGNARMLSKQELWHSYLSHMQERNLIVEGPLTSLKPSLMPLAVPERRFDRRAFSLGTRFSNRYKPTEHVRCPGQAGPEGQHPDVSDPTRPPQPPHHPPGAHRNSAPAAPHQRFSQQQMYASNPYAMGAIPMMPGGGPITQDNMGTQMASQLAFSQQHMSLGEMLGSFSLGGIPPYGAAPSQGFLDAAVPEMRGLGGHPGGGGGLGGLQQNPVPPPPKHIPPPFR